MDWSLPAIHHRRINDWYSTNWKFTQSQASLLIQCSLSAKDQVSQNGFNRLLDYHIKEDPTRKINESDRSEFDECSCYK